MKKNIFYLALLFIKIFASEQQEINFLHQFISAGDLVFDVGAHIGNKTKLYKSLGARVVCVEPQPDLVETLKKTFAQTQDVYIEPYALSDKQDIIKFYICSNATTISTAAEHWMHGRFNEYSWDKEIIVPTTTLNNLIKKYGHPVFCKIDVEGFELNVLRGLTIPIKYLSFEYTKEYFEQAAACINYLKSIGYRKFNCSVEEKPELLFNSWLNAEELVLFLSNHPNQLLWGDIYATYGPKE